MSDDKTDYEKAGATFLSEQPTVDPSKPLKDDPKWLALKASLETRLVALRNWRQSWWTQNWSDLAEFILPRRSIWLTQSTGGNPNPNNMTRGRPINNAIADPTATYAVRVCSSGLMSGLASPSRPWFKLIPSIKKLELDSEARAWIDDTEDRIYTVIAGSNFYNSFAQECEDLVVFGTGPNIIYEDEKDLIRCYTPAVGEYYLSSDATGRIDGLYRLFVMTVAQIVGFFGIENCSEEIQSLWSKKGNQLEVERMVAHAIEPNFDIEGFGKLPGNFTWRENYWIYGSKSGKPLSQRGFVDQPFTAARWSTQSNDAYGRSVGMDVLPDVMQLQVMTRRMAEAIEKQVRPPLIGSMELKNKPTSTLPGHLTFVTDMGPGKGIRPIYEVNPDVSAMAANIAQIEQRIQKGLFNDLFLMLENQPTADRMTAYEVAQKLQEKLQVLGPVIESLISDSLKPKLKRVFNILKRKGMIDPPPASLQGVPLDIEFVSMLALAQKGAATGGMERLIQIVGAMSPIYPTIKDNVDSDLYLREYNELLGNPKKVLRSPDEVGQIRQVQAQQVQQEQQMQAMERTAQAAGAAAPAAKVLSDVDTNGGQNVLGKLLGG
jgi:hypothetical protein